MYMHYMHTLLSPGNAAQLIHTYMQLSICGFTHSLTHSLAIHCIDAYIHTNTHIHANTCIHTCSSHSAASLTLSRILS